MGVTLEDYRWLVSEAAEPWLAVARERLVDKLAINSLVAQLRKELSAERAHLVVEQVELRQRAQEKFSRAERMFFTSKGLQQATDEKLAENKAARFPAAEPFCDLCCGVGGDLVALAGRGPGVGIDADAVMAVLAAANLAVCEAERSGCRVETGDAVATPLEQFAAWHCDPDRRTEGRRTTTIEWFSPTFGELDALLERNVNAAIKLAPATDVTANWAERAELEWLGSRGECRQQVAWFGNLARHPGQHSATVVERGATRTLTGSKDMTAEVAAECGKFIFEPHAAVLAAKLGGAIAAQHGLSALHPAVAYLTGDAPICDLAIDAFEVVDVLPLDRKQLRAYCREQKIGRLEIKKRGVDVDPAQLRRESAVDGDNAATIIVTPLGEKVRAIVARRAVSGEW